MGVKYLVQGAICKCRYGTIPDKLRVNTQSSVYLNDNECTHKLAATTADIGPTFEKNTFGRCAKKYKRTCIAQIVQWSGEEKQSLSGAGKLLTENSKATCLIGGKDCITVVYHGQQAEVTTQNINNVDAEVHGQVNPFVDVKKIEIDEKPEIKLNS